MFGSCRPHALLALLAATSVACDKQSQGTTPAPAGSASAASEVMTVSVRASRVGASEAPFAPGARARDDDRFAYYLTADHDAHAYVLQYFADGTRQVIYPPSGPAAALRPGVETRVPPPGQWFELYGCTGPESVVFVVSEAPLEAADPELEALVGRVKTTPPSDVSACSGGAAGAEAALVPTPSSVPIPTSSLSLPSGTASAVAPPPPPPKPVPARSVTLSPAPSAFAGELAHLRTRALKLGGDSLRSTADERGIAVVVFDYDHVPRDAP